MTSSTKSKYSFLSNLTFLYLRKFISNIFCFYMMFSSQGVCHNADAAAGDGGAGRRAGPVCAAASLPRAPPTSPLHRVHA